MTGESPPYQVRAGSRPFAWLRAPAELLQTFRRFLQGCSVRDVGVGVLLHQLESPTSLRVDH